MWAKGEEVVFINGHESNANPTLWNEQPLRVGQRVIVLHSADPGYECVRHGHTSVVWVTDSSWGYCPHCFRKPIDFSDLLQVTTEKELENA